MATAAQLGRFRILGRIGSGGMGEVLRAELIALGGAVKPVALKLVRPELGSDAGLLGRFLDEARLVTRLSHANIVQCFDVGREGDRLFLAMELVDGVSLGELLDQASASGKVLGFEHAVSMAIEVLQGLDYAHRCCADDGTPLGIVHRDISPQNILLSREGEVKITDFGIARSAMREDRTAPGTIVGKIPYMSPEQLLGQPVDARTDVYAVGAVMYEMLVGRPPVAADAGIGAIPAVLSGRFPQPRALRPEIPRPLEHIVMNALSKDARCRYATAGAMRKALESVAREHRWMLSSSDIAALATAALSSTSIPCAPGEATDSDATALAEETSGAGFDAALSANLRALAGLGSGFTASSTLGEGLPVRLAIHDDGVRQVPPSAPEAPPSAPGHGVFVRRDRTFIRQRWIFLFAVLLGGLVLFAAAARGPHLVAQGAGGREGPWRVDARPVVAPVENPFVPKGRSSGAPVARTSTHGSMGSGATRPESAGAERSSRRSALAEPESRRARARVAKAFHSTEMPGLSPLKEASRAAPPVASEPAPGSSEDARSVEPTQPAVVSINSDPWAHISINGAFVRSTPLVGYKLDPGSYEIDLRNEPLGLHKRVELTVRAGEERRVSVDLRSP